MQIFLTEAFTFMGLKLDASGNAGATPIRIELYEHTVADEHFYSMQTHFTCEVCENDVRTSELYAKESIRKRLVDDSFHNLCISHICATKYSSACLYSQGLFGFGGHYVNLDGGRVGRESRRSVRCACDEAASRSECYRSTVRIGIHRLCKRISRKNRGDNMGTLMYAYAAAGLGSGRFVLVCNLHEVGEHYRAGGGGNRATRLAFKSGAYRAPRGLP